MKNKKTLTLGLLATAASVLAACGGGGANSNKAVIKVWNFSGGFGKAWLDTAIAEYEAAHANDVYGTKTGVKFTVVPDKKNFKASELITYDLFFLEQANYVDYLASGAIEDITEVLTGTNPYEPGKTIESKMTDSQKAFYNRGDKYYGVPHYSGTYGITYDAKLFRENGYYLKNGHPAIVIGEEPDMDLCFTDQVSEYSLGPNGKTGVIDGVDYSFDDGLPATFAEFYLLCDRIALDDIAPFEFTGDTNKGGYLTSFASSLMNNLLGEDAAINYGFDGTIANPLEVDGTGKLVMDAETGAPKTMSTPLTVTDANGYESFRTKARYDAIDFVSNIFENGRYNRAADNSTHTYVTAEKYFVYGEKEASSKLTRSAMLIDGSWWETEAEASFKAMDKKYPGEGQSIMERDFRFMPLPRATEAEAAHQTYTDTLNALQCVRKGVSGYTKDICVDFLKFINTDAKLAEFNATTQAIRALKYDLDATQIARLSPYGKSVYQYANHPETETIYPISGSNKFVNGMNDYFITSANFKSKDYTHITDWFRKTYSAKTIFEGIYQFYKQNVWSAN